jgi:hypothetical protein
MKRLARVPKLLLVVGMALALITVVYAESLNEDPEVKPYLEGDGVRAGSSVDGTSALDKGWSEGEAGRSGGTTLEGTSLQEWLALTADGDLSVLYMFSGVTDDGEQGSASRREATSIHCTNISLESIQTEVQVYQWSGTDVYTGTVNMPPNRTFTFSTQNTTIYFDDVLLGGSPGADAIFQGSGRVLTSQPGVICTAQVLDPLNYPPAFVSALELFRK